MARTMSQKEGSEMKYTVEVSKRDGRVWSVFTTNVRHAAEAEAQRRSLTEHRAFVYEGSVVKSMWRRGKEIRNCIKCQCEYTPSVQTPGPECYECEWSPCYRECSQCGQRFIASVTQRAVCGTCGGSPHAKSVESAYQAAKAGGDFGNVAEESRAHARELLRYLGEMLQGERDGERLDTVERLLTDAVNLLSEGPDTFLGRTHYAGRVEVCGRCGVEGTCNCGGGSL